MEQRVGGQYHVGRKIGSGSFGQIHLGVDVYTGEQVAIKFESVHQKHPMLYFESKLYSYLRGGYGIPKVRWYGVAGQQYALVMDLLGCSLENLFIRCGRKFSLKTVLMLAEQMLNAVEYVHSKSFVHRDIKPENFMMGLGTQASQVFVIDFGLAKKYRDTVTHKHILFRYGVGLNGTARFASINAHNGIEQTRRDDLESLGYVLMYFLRGSLPWQEMTPSTTCTSSGIRDKKVCTSINDLCHGFPSEFKYYFRYCQALKFDEAPDYAYLKRLFRNIFVRRGYQYDYIFDWTVVNYQQSKLTAEPEPEPEPKPAQGGEREKRYDLPCTQQRSVYQTAHKSSLDKYSKYCVTERLQTPFTTRLGDKSRTSAVVSTKKVTQRPSFKLSPQPFC